MSDKYQIFPALSVEEYQALKADIAQHGILVPIEKDEAGNVLDGHHRIRAWEELRSEGVKVPDYPRSIRAGLSEIEKVNHIRGLNLLRRHLTTEQQAPHLVEMRRTGMTYQLIAEKSGLSDITIRRSLGETTFVVSEIINTRGQKRPPKYKPRQPKTILTLNGKEESRILTAVNKVGVGALPDKIVTEKRGERICREAEAEQRRAELITDIETNPQIHNNGHKDIRLGRFQDILNDIPEATIDLIFTDPPYGGEYLSEWADFAEYASRLLKPSSYLVTYSGQAHLPKVLAILNEKLHYVWTIALIHGSCKKNIITHNKIYSQWKPLLIFCKEPFMPPTKWINDILKGVEMEKDLHDWQQGLSEAEFIIKNYSQPGDTILDPFLGSGTTAIACLELNRKIIGCDVDAACISQTLERINAQN